MLASAVRTAMRLLSPPGARGRLSVLIYHRVIAQPDEFLGSEPHAAEFEETMRWVKRVFRVLPLRDGVAGLKSGKLPDRALCITFDDGYADNESVAAPILAKLGLHATFFIASAYLDGGRMFNDSVFEAVRRHRGSELDLTALGLGTYRTGSVEEKSKAIAQILEAVKYRPVAERSELAERIAQIAQATLPTDLMMTSAQAANLARMGFELGGHTETHPILAQLDADAARREIEGGKRRVEELAGTRVGLFAYPNGRPHRDYSRATVELVRNAGFDAAVSTSHGAARIGEDPFQIPRFTPWDRSRPKFAARLVSNLTRVAPTYVTA
jgi:peptidoglycan/xylan/chitin deacetylase (PgdA/CDA1 family)